MSAEETQLTTRQETSLLSVIDRIVASGLTTESVAALDKLLQMQERVQAQQRKQAFIDAMVRLQAKIPQIAKDGRIIVKGNERSRYARLQDIHNVLQPLMAEEGFAADFNEETYNETTVTFIMTVSHRDGHSETKRKTFPHDKAAVGQYGPIRSAIQDAGSTTSYARRQLYKMHFNIIEKDEDTDGTNIETINADQVKDIETALADTKSDKAKFLRLIAGVEKLEDIPVRDLKRIMNALEETRRARAPK